ncbi:MAG: hypothetical protein GY749_16845 [Desulfobacteraceae bacterium]|nr:hypothetical protein [Desulfobacteraceae bacterium]
MIIRLIVLFFVVFFIPKSSFGNQMYYPEIFTLEEAKLIWDIEAMIDKYQQSDSESRQTITDNILESYYQHKESFIEIVIVNSLLEIGKLNVIKKDKSEKFQLLFAEKTQKDLNSSLKYIDNTRNPGLRQFLETWLVFRSNEKLTNETYSYNRQKKIMGKYKQVNKQIAKRKAGNKYDILFKTIENWKEPIEYESAMLLISDEYIANPDEVVSRLIELLNMQHIPESPPPPYLRNHTVFYILCTLAKSLNDKKLVETIEYLAESNNIYVSTIASEALLWLKKGVRYPLKYHELKRSYKSRS